MGVNQAMEHLKKNPKMHEGFHEHIMQRPKEDVAMAAKKMAAGMKKAFGGASAPKLLEKQDSAPAYTQESLEQDLMGFEEIFGMDDEKLQEALNKYGYNDILNN